MLNRKKNNKGFTLVELLVVIAIIGILAVVAVPALFKNINKAKVADVESDYSAIKSAVLSYYTDNNTLPENEEVLDDDAISLKWSEVGKVVTAYKFIIVKPKDKKNPSFLYRKKHFKTEEEYQEVVDTIHKYYELYLEKEGKKYDTTQRSKKRRNR